MLVSFFGTSYATKGTFVDYVKFIQYLDENTALEEVRNGNLDIYYYRIPSDRIENIKSRQGLEVFESTGGSYSLLVNPAESEKFNPFSIQQIRFALNYLIDRKLIVNELLGGFGNVMISNYGPYDPDFLSIIKQVESFNFRYNPSLAKKIIDNELNKVGAVKNEDTWYYDGGPVEVTLFIRSDDPVRKSIGEILASELQKVGFVVKKDFGDLNKAFVVVYGSNPSDLKWNLYTEGWGGRSAFVKYDSAGLAQMYSPWFSNMPGFNNPTYWNYQNPYLDELTQKIYSGNFTSSLERAKLIQDATVEGIKESVRIFLASKIDQYVANKQVYGIINDFGAGVPSRFTPINSRTSSDHLNIGVKQIYQGAWNPVAGFTDSYSTQIWNTLYDPVIFKHPFTGESIPIRTNWKVVSAGPLGKLEIPDDAVLWDSESKSWEYVPSTQQAISKVTFDLIFSDWHHDQPMNMNDILYSLYFLLEWGSPRAENDKTFDSEFTPRASQSVNTIKAIRILDENTIEVYVDFWHFDESEIADWASVWSTMPWEIYAAMENAVVDGKTSFSRSGATSKNVNWLSLIVPNDAQLIRNYLINFNKTNYVPPALQEFITPSDAKLRYNASINWISEKNHAVISNGPFYLEGYAPESRTILISAFDDESYPFAKGHWKKFEQVKFPKILKVDVPSTIIKGKAITIPIVTQNASKLFYFITDPHGIQKISDIIDISDNNYFIKLDKKFTSELEEGTYDLKLFVISDEVLRPDDFLTSFFITDEQHDLLEFDIQQSSSERFDNLNMPITAFIVFVVIGMILIWKFKIIQKLFSSN